MSDPNLTEFYGRVARFERARANGYGFDAEGTLGRSYFLKKAKPRRSWLGVGMMVALCAFGMKAVIFQSVGAAAYNSRVATLQAGEGFDRLGGWMMQADPATRFAAQKITQGLAVLK